MMDDRGIIPLEVIDTPLSRDDQKQFDLESKELVNKIEQFEEKISNDPELLQNPQLLEDPEKMAELVYKYSKENFGKDLVKVDGLPDSILI